MAEQAAIARDVADYAQAIGFAQFALSSFDQDNRAALHNLHSASANGQGPSYHRRLCSAKHRNQGAISSRFCPSKTLVSVVFQY